MRNFDYLEPTTVAEACALLKQHGGDAKVFAGGAHLTILMKQGLYQPKVLVNIKKIPALKGIHFDAKKRLIIGALVTHRDIETSEHRLEKSFRCSRKRKEKSPTSACATWAPSAAISHPGNRSQIWRRYLSPWTAK